MADLARIRAPVLLAANTQWYLLNFRRETISALIEDGHPVHCAAPPDDKGDALRDLGATVHDAPPMPSRMSPFSDLRYIAWMRRLVSRIAPGTVFTFTPKANVYTGLATIGRTLDFVPNVSGLGRIFEREGLLATIAVRLYRLAFAQARAVMFQNRESRSLFVDRGVVDERRANCLMGSGVDLERFAAQPLPEDGPRTFLFSGRLVESKGLREYVAAARAIAANTPESDLPRFLMVGFTQATMGSTITAGDLEQIIADSPVEYLGPTDDVRAMLAECHCFVLPSYYGEGVPRSAIEAAATGRPIITTDHPGCRDTVANGVNGYLVPPRDAMALERAMRRILQLSVKDLADMALASRTFAEERFDVSANVQAYREIANG